MLPGKLNFSTCFLRVLLTFFMHSLSVGCLLIIIHSVFLQFIDGPFPLLDSTTGPLLCLVSLAVIPGTPQSPPYCPHISDC